MGGRGAPLRRATPALLRGGWLAATACVAVLVVVASGPPPVAADTSGGGGSRDGRAGYTIGGELLRSGLERSDLAVRRVPLIFAWK